jgi:hypothetical protein
LSAAEKQQMCLKNLIEGTLVPELLQKLLLTLWFFVSHFRCVFQIFLHPLLLGQSSSAFNFFSLFFTRQLFFLLLFDPRQLP